MMNIRIKVIFMFVRFYIMVVIFKKTTLNIRPQEREEAHRAFMTGRNVALELQPMGIRTLHFTKTLRKYAKYITLYKNNIFC